MTDKLIMTMRLLKEVASCLKIVEEDRECVFLRIYHDGENIHIGRFLGKAAKEINDFIIVRKKELIEEEFLDERQTKI
jgi:hypothetical protein